MAEHKNSWQTWILAMVVGILYPVRSNAEKIEARGFAVLGNPAAARKKAEDRAFEDLADRIYGFSFVADPEGGVKIARAAPLDFDPAKLGAKISDVCETESGMIVVTVEAETPREWSAERTGAQAFQTTGTAKFGKRVDVSSAAAQARTNALENAVLKFIETKYMHARGPVPQRIAGRLFLEGATGEGQSKTQYLVTCTVLVKASISTRRGAGPANIRIDVDYTTFARGSQGVGNTYGEYKAGKWTLRRGGPVKTREGLNARVHRGRINGGVQLGEFGSIRQNASRQSIVLLDGTTGIIDLGGITSIRSPGVVRQYDARLRRWVYAPGEYPRGIRVGRRLVVGARALSDGKIRVGVSLERSGVVGRARRSIAYTRLGTNVVVRDGQALEIGGFSSGNLWARRLGTGQDARRGASENDTTIVLTARVLRAR